jgi:hypothetical protein
VTTYRNLEIIASDDDRPGFVRVFAVHGDSIIPLGETKSGHLEQFGRSPLSLAVKAQDAAKAEQASSPPEAP